MAVEYGATTAFFPIDEETLRYLHLTGRAAGHVDLVEAYAKEQGLWHDSSTNEPLFSDIVEFDLSTVEPSLAGPRRPEDRVPLTQVPANFTEAVSSMPRRDTSEATAAATRNSASAPRLTTTHAGPPEKSLLDGDVVIAAITSCTNTSNPSVLIAAGLLARNAVARGLRSKPWVKTNGTYLSRRQSKCRGQVIE